MLSIIVFFLFAGLLLYVVFAGADFGAGILELFARRKDYARVERLTYEAIGPVWEANHVWLILVVVILFNGFPEVYATYSTYLHLPLMLMLLGIVLRGTMFIFRHYDAMQDGSQRYYARLFQYSSFVTPLFLGMTLGATVLGRIDPGAADFYGAYLAPWLNSFSLLVGLLFCGISAFVAAVFLSGEAHESALRLHFARLAMRSNLLTVGIGVLVFASAEWSGLALLRAYLDAPVAILSVAFATMALPLLWRALQSGLVWWARFLAGFQVAMILLGWAWVQYPVLVRLAGGDALTAYETQAPAAVQQVLVWSLVLGSLAIFPALYYLFRVFKVARG
ncbi:MAG: cytochrome d ubiquinol oxidase subunit II [Bacteroidia bacterium]